MANLKGLATGVGSLPFIDADEAVDFIFKYVPQIPFWPQLPKRDFREGMVAQYTEGLPAIRLSRQGIYIEDEAKDKELEQFYEDIIVKDASRFKISSDYAAGLWKFYQRLEDSDLSSIEYIKCQITGPFTFAASINGASGNSILFDEVMMQAVVKGLAMKALWQIELFKKFGKKIIMFIDEPYLGCFGSAFTPINREVVVNGLKELIAGFKSQDVLVGVHCCGNTDWSIFTETEQIDIINFDAFSFTEKVALYAQDIAKFFTRRGILCWGIVPTQELGDEITGDTLFKKLNDGIKLFENKGVRKDLLLDRLMISPACGLGSLDASQPKKIFSLLNSLSLALK